MNKALTVSPGPKLQQVVTFSRQLLFFIKHWRYLPMCHESSMLQGHRICLDTWFSIYNVYDMRVTFTYF